MDVAVDVLELSILVGVNGPDNGDEEEPTNPPARKVEELELVIAAVLMVEVLELPVDVEVVGVLEPKDNEILEDGLGNESEVKNNDVSPLAGPLDEGLCKLVASVEIAPLELAVDIVVMVEVLELMLDVKMAGTPEPEVNEKSGIAADIDKPYGLTGGING